MAKVQLGALIHFVWSTQYRQPTITPQVDRRLKRYISTVCLDQGCTVVALGGMPDHIHLLVVFGNTVSFADLMHGGSSRFVNAT